MCLALLARGGAYSNQHTHPHPQFSYFYTYFKLFEREKVKNNV